MDAINILEVNGDYLYAENIILITAKLYTQDAPKLHTEQIIKYFFSKLVS